MAKKRGRKKKNQIKIDLQIIALITISVLFATLIYTNSGVVGKSLNVILGGLFSWIKYVLPIGFFAIGVYMIFKKEESRGKILHYVIFIISIITLMSIIQFSKGTYEEFEEFEYIVETSYSLGVDNVGGGAVGTLVALLFTKLLGVAGATVIFIGILIINLIFMFGLQPIQYIKDKVESIKKDREKISKDDLEKFKEKEIAIQEEIKDEKPKSRLKLNRKKDANDFDEEQIKINIKEESLFKQEEVRKEENTKQVLTLDHTLTVEDHDYEFPPITLLQESNAKKLTAKKSLQDTASKLQKTLYSFGVSAKVENVSVGPAITRYELKPAEGVRVNKIANLADDIALNLAAETIRIEAPIPGKQAVGIEIPNKEKEAVHLRDIISSSEFQNEESKTAFAIGKDVAGEVVVSDISKMPHVLIAGSTGSGKSVCINTLITSILYKAKPSEVKLVMIDPKVVELSVYNGIPHLLIPVVTDTKKAAGALLWAVQEMVKRYGLFAEKGVRDIKGYNKIIETEGAKLPHIVIIIDELADLMMVSPKDVEDSICRLAQMARAAGMHLVIATQRPSVDVITGTIKANVPSRISFAVSSGVDSRTILDMYGAEKLLGKGDMLFFPSGASKPQRIQGAFISDSEVEKIVEFLKAGKETTYDEDVIEKIEKANTIGKDFNENDDDTDDFLMEAIETVIETGQASTSFIQRKFKVGYARAGRIMDQMEERGIISGYEGSKPRQVLMSKERWEELKMSTGPGTDTTNEE